MIIPTTISPIIAFTINISAKAVSSNNTVPPNPKRDIMTLNIIRMPITIAKKIVILIFYLNLITYTGSDRLMI